MPVQFVVVNGDYDGSLVVLKKNGASVLSVPGEKNMQLKLSYNENYLVSFSKPGYITKQISVDTKVAQERIETGFDPYKIGVRLYKQYDGINTVVYNQPVASIRFLASIDDFGYDTDYTKSILSALTETENLLSIKSEEERTSGKNTSKHKKSQEKSDDDFDDIINVNKKDAGRNNLTSAETHLSEKAGTVEEGKSPGQNITATNNNAETRSNSPVSGSDEPAGNNYGSGSDSKKNSDGAAGEDHLKKESVTGSGKDVHPQETAAKDIADISSEEIHEPHRTITKVTVVKKGARTVFHKVQYLNGECYYFMNGSKAISGHLYDYFTREQ